MNVTDLAPMTAGESLRDSPALSGSDSVTPAKSHALDRDAAVATDSGSVTAGCDSPDLAAPRCVTPPLVLSLFPGIDLFGRGFEAEGFCVVRGPDLVWGGDVRRFHPPPGRFEGIIAGSPCQDFSRARRAEPTGEGLELLGEFVRVVCEARPLWFLLENVPTVPTVTVEGYRVQRLDLDARECGLNQRRLRHFQFGSAEGKVLIVQRALPLAAAQPQPTCLASEGRRQHRRTWADFWGLQGLPRDFALPQLTKGARYAAVGNGVAVPVARVLAEAVKRAVPWHSVRLCACGCGRRLRQNQIAATPACRKRLQRRRDCAIASEPRGVTVTDLALPFDVEAQSAGEIVLEQPPVTNPL